MYGQRPNRVLLILCTLTVYYSGFECGVMAITATATFNMDGVTGIITFVQSPPNDNRTTVLVALSGLHQYPTERFPWHVHEYPFMARPDACSTASVGGHFDPLMASNNPNYSSVCSEDNPLQCEVGDLSGKFGRLPAVFDSIMFRDSYLPLYGIHSIVGRSVVIHHGDGARWVCANIDYLEPLDDVTIAYSPLRSVLTGNIYFIQPLVMNPTTTVFTRLSYLNGSVDSTGHNWHVHENTIGSTGNCDDGGPHYNSRGIPTNELTYEKYCNPSNQTSCEIGDLSGKSSQLDFINGYSTLLYSDTELPLRVNTLGESIVGRSVVVHAKDSGALRIACANISEYTPRTAIARFQEDGVSGQIIFHQVSPFSPTTITVELTGLSSRASGYHVHDFPVDETAPGSEKCANSFAGDHFNPRNVVLDTSSPITFDAYEIGDLSGKYGSLADQDSINAIYSDPYLPLFGVDSIVGRSIVIHYPNGSRWLCANIKYDMDTVSVTANITSGALQGKLVLTQLANDPFSETTIFLTLSVVEIHSTITLPTQVSMVPSTKQSYIFSTNLIPSATHSPVDNSTVTTSPSGNDTNSDQKKKKDIVKRKTQASGGLIRLSIRTSCDKEAPIANPYGAPLTCSPDDQLACPVGDLTGKHGVLSERSLLTDLNLPLTGSNAVTRLGLAVRLGDANMSSIVCILLPRITGTVSTPTPTVATPTATSVMTGSAIPVTTSSGTTGSAIPVTTGSTIPVTTGSAITVITGSAIPVTTGSAIPVTTGSAIPVTTGSAIPVTTRSAIPVTTGSAIPVTTDSAIPVTTSSASTGSAIPVISISAVPVITSSAIPVTTGSAIPVTNSSAISVTTGSAIPVTTGSVIPVTTGSVIPVTTYSAIPLTTGSAIPVTTDSAIPVTTDSAIPVTTGSASTGSAIPVTTISAIPVMTSSAVPVTTGSATPVTNSSAIPVTTGSAILVTTGSVIPVTTGSAIPVTTDSAISVTTGSAFTGSAIPVTTSSAIPVTTSSAIPVTTGSAIPVTTGSAIPVTTGSAIPVTTGSAIPVTTGSAIPVTTASAIPVTTGSANPVITGSANPVITGSVIPVTTGSAIPVTTGSANLFITSSVTPTSSTSSPTPTNTSSGKNKDNKEIIIIASGTGGGVAVVVFLVLLVAISYCMWRRHKKRSQYFGGSGQSSVEYQQLLPVELTKRSRSKFRRKKKHKDDDGEDCVEL